MNNTLKSNKPICSKKKAHVFMLKHKAYSSFPSYLLLTFKYSPNVYTKAAEIQQKSSAKFYVVPAHMI